MNATADNRSVLGDIARRAMLARHLQPEFPPAALRQLDGLRAAAASAASDVRDLRALLWASVDNDDSRDLDQLSVAEPLADDAVRILIAIADVDALVTRGSPIDQHAQFNTTSVYTVAQVFSMLPLQLSTALTSLVEGESRLALVIEMTIDAAGAISSSDIYRAQVINRAKLAYNGVAAWLEGAAPAPERVQAVPGLAAQLRLQDGVAQRLRRVRHVHGALSLATVEPQAVFDGAILRDLIPATSNRAHELIEDFMIAANGVTARYLQARGWASLRRVLRTPQRWPRIVALARQLGEQLPETASALALNEFLTRRQQADAASFPDLCLAVVKLLGRGEYVLQQPGQPVAGHFGLAVDDYTHATAPNRRFPDLLTQRLLKAALTGQATPYQPEELRALAAHCTAQEDNAAKVERAVRKSAAALLLSTRIGMRFDAVVTGAADKGTWVRIAAPAAEGRLVRGFDGLDVGDRLRVALVSTDVERGYIDFERMS